MRSVLADVWRVFLRQRAALAALLALVAIAVASPSVVILSQVDPEAISVDVLGRPSLAHAMGTDYLGRDILGRVLHIPTYVSQFFGGTSMLIAVGVMLDTMRQMESHLLMRHYDGFLKKGRLKGRF